MAYIWISYAAEFLRITKSQILWHISRVYLKNHDMVLVGGGLMVAPDAMSAGYTLINKQRSVSTYMKQSLRGSRNYRLTSWSE
jgi:hypothetical protein